MRRVYTGARVDGVIGDGICEWVGGHMADFFTMAVKTGKQDGYSGISLLLVDAKSAGLRVRKMKTQFDTTHSTTFLTLDDVRVPGDPPLCCRH